MSNEADQHTPAFGPAPCWPSFAEYCGGGTLLREWNASDYNLDTYCADDSRERVRDLIRSGYDVIVLRGKIVAVEKDRFRSANVPDQRPGELPKTL